MQLTVRSGCLRWIKSCIVSETEQSVRLLQGGRPTDHSKYVLSFSYLQLNTSTATGLNEQESPFPSLYHQHHHNHHSEKDKGPLNETWSLPIFIAPTENCDSQSCQIAYSVFHLHFKTYWCWCHILIEPSSHLKGTVVKELNRLFHCKYALWNIF